MWTSKWTTSINKNSKFWLYHKKIELQDLLNCWKLTNDKPDRSDQFVSYGERGNNQQIFNVEFWSPKIHSKWRIKSMAKIMRKFGITRLLKKIIHFWWTIKHVEWFAQTVLIAIPHRNEMNDLDLESCKKCFHSFWSTKIGSLFVDSFHISLFLAALFLYFFISLFLFTFMLLEIKNTMTKQTYFMLKNNEKSAKCHKIMVSASLFFSLFDN